MTTTTIERDLREQRQSAWTQAQEFNNRAKAGETLSGEDESGWQRALDDVDTLSAKIENLERSATLDAKFNSIDEQRSDIPTAPGDIPNGDDAYRAAFDSFVRRGIDRISPEERQLIEANFAAPGSRAQGEATGSAGGYTVPQGFWAKVTETMKYYGGMLDVAEVIDTDTGIALPWATNDDTSNTGAILAENTQITAQDLTFGQKTLNAYTYTSKLILVSLQLLQDTGIDLEAFLARKIGQRLGRIYNTHLTTGTGSSQPQGFVTGATNGKTTASATAITFDEVIDLLHSVDVAYRSQGASWMLHDLVLAYIRKLKDGQSRYLWEPSPIVGVPSAIEGYPYTINNDMASTVVANNITMAFGGWKDFYVARRVAGGQMMRLAERYADYLQVGFFGFGRIDGLVQDASAVKVMTQHS